MFAASESDEIKVGLAKHVSEFFTSSFLATSGAPAYYYLLYQSQLHTTLLSLSIGGVGMTSTGLDGTATGNPGASGTTAGSKSTTVTAHAPA